MKEASSICDRATDTGSALVTPAVVDRWRARMVTSAIMEESALSYSMFKMASLRKYEFSLLFVLEKYKICLFLVENYKIVDISHKNQYFAY